MCLNVRRTKSKNFLKRIFKKKDLTKPLIAKRDIICYKNYFISNVKNDVISIYQHETYNLTEPLPEVKFGISVRNKDFISIEEGYHSYVKPNKQEMGKIFKCIIPKGSLYFVGNFNSENDAYASNNIKIIERYEE